jgi:hypothetical protein
MAIPYAASRGLGWFEDGWFEAPDAGQYVISSRDYLINKIGGMWAKAEIKFTLHQAMQENRLIRLKLLKERHLTYKACHPPSVSIGDPDFRTSEL